MLLKTLFVVLLVTAANAGAATVLSFGPAPVSVNVGDTFELSVFLVDLPGLTPAPEIAGFSFDVLFPSFLQVLTAPVEQGFFFATGCCYSPGIIDNVNGVISGIADVDIFGDGETGVDPLVQIQFIATATGTGQITFDNAGLTDPNGDAVTIDGLGTADVTSSPTPEPATWAMAFLGAAIVVARNLRRSARSSRA